MPHDSKLNELSHSRLMVTKWLVQRSHWGWFNYLYLIVSMIVLSNTICAICMYSYFIYMQVCICMYVCVFVCIYVCVRICMCGCVCTDTYRQEKR